jgi:predicted N-acetyltransferase YhbS
VVIRRAIPEDAAVCGDICYRAFTKINIDHGFPPEIPSPEMAVMILSEAFASPLHYCVVAELDGRVAGSNCLDERAAIFGVGPITIDPDLQNRGVGRALMEAVLQRSHEQNAAGVRLVQAAFHNRSLALYSSLGFDSREPLTTFQGPPLRRTTEGYHVRAASEGDLEACNQLCRRVHGFDRGRELEVMMRHGTAVCVERSGRVTGYATATAFWGHAVAENNEDLKAILAAAASFDGPGILVPTRNSDLFRWCLANGLKAIQPNTLMTLGLYNEPAGAYLPSILF